LIIKFFITEKRDGKIFQEQAEAMESAQTFGNSHLIRQEVWRAIPANLCGRARVEKGFRRRIPLKYLHSGH
jgi:hypothetical protein